MGVIGSSGSGKSSLIFAGLVPALQAGFLVGDRDRWVLVRLTPGDSPWLRLSDALASGARPDRPRQGRRTCARWPCARGVSGPAGGGKPAAAAGQRQLAAVRRPVRGDLPARRGDGSPSSTKRTRTSSRWCSDSRASATLPVFVVLTMRSDHLGDCDDFLGLPEALNESQYLVPRLNRERGPARDRGADPAVPEGRRVAARGPPAERPRRPARPAAGAAARADAHVAAPRRERASRRWTSSTTTTSVRSADALWRHADEALAGLDPAAVHAKEAVKAALEAARPEEIGFFRVVFQALTDTDHANRKVRRWQNVRDLRELTGRTLPELHGLLERFVDDRRSFLRYSGEGGSTGPDSMLVDISHESLIRQWDRLRGWVDEEAHDRDAYVRIARRRQSLGAGARRPLGGPGARPGAAVVGQAGAHPGLGEALSRRFRGGARASCARASASATWSSAREKEERHKEQERKELAAHNASIRRTQRWTAVAAVVFVSLAVTRSRSGGAQGEPSGRVERAGGLGARPRSAPIRSTGLRRGDRGGGEGRDAHVSRRTARGAGGSGRPEALVGSARARLGRGLQPRRPPARGRLDRRDDARPGRHLGRRDRRAADVALRTIRHGAALDPGGERAGAGARRRTRRRSGRLRRARTD